MKQEDMSTKQLYKKLHSARRSGSFNEMYLTLNEAAEKRGNFTAYRLGISVSRARHGSYPSIRDFDLNTRLGIYKELKKNNKHNYYRTSFIK